MHLICCSFLVAKQSSYFVWLVLSALFCLFSNVTSFTFLLVCLLQSAHSRFFSPRGHLNECLVTPAEFLRAKHPASSVLCLVVVVVVVVCFVDWLVSQLKMSLSSIFRFSVLTPSTIFCMSWGIVQERKAVFYRSAIQTSHTNAPLPSPLISPIQTTPSLKICSLMTCSNLMRRFTSAKKSRRVERCYVDFFFKLFPCKCTAFLSD